MSDKPTIHITNWSSRKLHSGNVYTIMAYPNGGYGQWGAGRVAVLAPLGTLTFLMTKAIAERKDGVVGGPKMVAYQAAYVGWLSEIPKLLRPDGLRAFGLGDSFVGASGQPVAGGDTIACACSRAEAAAGRCHRSWAIPFLQRAGWSVVADGVRGPMSRPELLDSPSPAVCATESKGTTVTPTTGIKRSSDVQRASDLLYLGAGIRRLTVAECQILQAWPSDWPLQGGITAGYKIVGNGCCPPVVEAIGRAVLKSAASASDV